MIMGLDTHMILEAVPVLLRDTPHRPRRHQPDITPPCRGPRVQCVAGVHARPLLSPRPPRRQHDKFRQSPKTLYISR